MTLENDVADSAKGPVVLIPLSRPQRGGLRLQHLMYTVVVVAVLIWLAMLARYGLILLVILGGVAFAVAGAVLLARRNATQRESLLWALAIASERSMPLAPAALAFADQYGASFRWRVQLLAALLEEGSTLPEAMDQVPGLFPRESVALIRCGWATGNLPGALRQAALLRNARRSALGDAAGRVGYLLVVIVQCQAILGFLAYFIAPKLSAIFADFGVPLPGPTAWMLGATNYLDSPWAFLAVPVLLLELAALIVLPLAGLNLFQWEVPVLDDLFRKRHAALILRALSLAIDAGRPIPEALGALAEGYPSSAIRRRLRGVLAAVNRGEGWIKALLERGLIRQADAALLLSAERVGNLGWALHEAADAIDRRAGYRLRMVLEALFPLAILMMGLLVFAIAVGYFYPLITLIEVLAR